MTDNLFVIKNKGRQVRPIWQILVVVFITLSIPLSLLVLNGTLDFFSSAGPAEEPQEIVISNISDKSAFISFETPDELTKSVVTYSAEATESQSTAVNETQLKEGAHVHYHRLSNLVPNTTYFFEITVGSQTYENESFTFKTLEVSENVSTPDPVYGKIAASQEVTEGIIYLHANNPDGGVSSIVSTLIPPSGTYAIDLGGLKNPNGSLFLSNNEAQITLFANTGELGKGAVTVSADTDQIPDIELSSDFPSYDPTRTFGGGEEPTPSPTTPLPTPDNSQTDSTALLTSTFSLPGDAGTTPKDIFISNLTNLGMTVNWRTSEPATGSVAYGIEATPSKITYDKRDSVDVQTPRYTHIVDIVDSEISSGERIEFLLVSNEIEYKEDNNRNFSLTIPEVPAGSNAPSPLFQSGRILPDFNMQNPDDFLIAIKTPDSLWASAATSDDLLWNVALGNILTSELNQFASIQNSSLEVRTYGELNSYTEVEEEFNAEEEINLSISEGLTVNINDRTYQPNDQITGTAEPNSTINITSNTGASAEVTANSEGEWQYAFAETGTNSNVTYTFSDDRTSLKYNIVFAIEQLPVTNPTPIPTPVPISTPVPTPPPPTPTPHPLEDAGALPDTAITDHIPLITAVLIFASGVILNSWVKKNKNWK